MNSILTHIANLKQTIDTLIPKYLKLKAYAVDLENEKLVLKNKVQYLESEIKKINKRIEIIDLTKGVGEKDSYSIGFTKNRVNTLIREIDKCLSLLND